MAISNNVVSESNQQRNELEAIADEYFRRRWKGESLDLEEFIQDFPHIAEDLRELLPVAELLDRARHATDSGPLKIRGSNIEAGTRIGEYQLLRCIGRGGMGVVYQAEHITLGSRVAIKLLPGDASDNPKLRERFLREASASARMNHPNIVRVFDYGSEDGLHYFAMSLIEGVGLDQLLARDGMADFSARTLDTDTSEDSIPPEQSVRSGADSPNLRKNFEDLRSSNRSTLPVRGPFSSASLPDGQPSTLWHWAANIGMHAADALSYAHNMGVIHRDIKPSNMMLDDQGNLFITDFGLAKISDDNSLTATGDLLGTLRYLPPESLHGKADTRGDIYGLGLTLYELLSGEPAYANIDRAKLFHDISIGDIVPLQKKVPKVPRDLAQIVKKATEPDPALRYSTAAAMRDDLGRFLAGEPIKARPASIGYRASRWIGRNRAVSSLAVCLFAILAITAAASMYSALSFRDLALEKQNETNAAISSARRAKINLLRAQLSDASGWATSVQVGQRVEGLKSLRDAIQLARELGLFSRYQDQFYEKAVTLSALHDAPVITEWPDGKMASSQATISFNGDLTEYVLGDYRSKRDCLVYRVEGSRKELVERIPLERPCLGRIRFSSDGSLVCCWTDAGNGRIALWIHDRNSHKSFFLDEHSRENSGFGLQILNGTSEVAFINSTGKLVLYNVSNGTETVHDLPQNKRWQQLAVSHGELKIALYEVGHPELILLSLKDGSVESVELGGSGIRAVAWRPDDRHLAIGTSKILIWDLSRRIICTTLNQENTYVDRLNYGGGGRLLFSSGWLSRTEVHDVLAERRIFRCESIVSDVSDSGEFAAFFAGPNVRIRQIVNSDTIREFNYSRLHRERYAGVDCATGLLWLGPHYKVAVYDLSTNRSLLSHHCVNQETFVAVDPQGRDTFASFDDQVFRLPIVTESQKGEASNSVQYKYRIGPPELLLKSGDIEGLTANTISLDASGNKLGMDSRSSYQVSVLDRQKDWKPGTRNTANFFPAAVAPHPDLPLVVTSSHSANGIEVLDTQTDSVVFSLPYNRAFANFSPDGRRLLVQSGGRLRVFEVGSWKHLATSKPYFSAGDNPPALSNDSKWIALQTQDPRGVSVMAMDTLEEALFFRGHHLDPDSFIGSFEATGRFLVANHGQKVIATWDLYQLKLFFESLGLEWPLPGLGNPTPVRDPNIEVEVILATDERR
jgi:serine/threonine protein kinase